MRFSLTALSGLVFLSGSALAHPGHDMSTEIAERREFLNSVKRASLSHCTEKLAARGVHQRNIQRRAAQVEQARAKRGITKRDLDSVLSASHNETGQGYSVSTDPSILFAGNHSCVLTPEVTQGPYYVSGEYVRRNIIEDQEGIDVILDYQVIDVDTCEPVPNVYLEIWHCNSTGVYSGIVASGNGESSDSENIDTTFLRGIQLTDSDGVAQFESLFPGHYTSRANHIHLMVHTNATLYPNNTLGSKNYASHVGQAFFDQDLISDVETNAPYNTNTQDLTTNEDDSILSEETETDGVDPMMEYTYLGKSVKEGLFLWLSFGINTTLSDEITPAAYLYTDGGVENDDSGSIGGGSPASGTPPSATTTEA